MDKRKLKADVAFWTAAVLFGTGVAYFGTQVQSDLAKQQAVQEQRVNQKLNGLQRELQDQQSQNNKLKIELAKQQGTISNLEKQLHDTQKKVNF